MALQLSEVAFIGCEMSAKFWNVVADSLRQTKPPVLIFTLEFLRCLQISFGECFRNAPLSRRIIVDEQHNCRNKAAFFSGMLWTGPETDVDKRN